MGCGMANLSYCLLAGYNNPRQFKSSDVTGAMACKAIQLTPETERMVAKWSGKETDSIKGTCAVIIFLYSFFLFGCFQGTQQRYRRLSR
jgi:hypothetical protein